MINAVKAAHALLCDHIVAGRLQETGETLKVKQQLEAEIEKHRVLSVSHDGQGTPKSLDEAVLRALMVGPLKDTRERMQLAVRDFLAQKFSTAMLTAPTEDESVRLQDLFNRIVS